MAEKDASHAEAKTAGHGTGSLREDVGAPEAQGTNDMSEGARPAQPEGSHAEAVLEVIRKMVTFVQPTEENPAFEGAVFLSAESPEVVQFWRMTSRLCDAERENLVRWWTGLESSSLRAQAVGQEPLPEATSPDFEARVQAAVRKLRPEGVKMAHPRSGKSFMTASSASA